MSQKVECLVASWQGSIHRIQLVVKDEAQLVLRPRLEALRRLR